MHLQSAINDYIDSAVIDQTRSDIDNDDKAATAIDDVGAVLDDYAAATSDDYDRVFEHHKAACDCATVNPSTSIDNGCAAPDNDTAAAPDTDHAAATADTDDGCAKTIYHCYTADSDYGTSTVYYRCSAPDSHKQPATDVYTDQPHKPGTRADISADYDDIPERGHHYHAPQNGHTDNRDDHCHVSRRK